MGQGADEKKERAAIGTAEQRDKPIVAFADGDEAQLRNLRLYASCKNSFQVAGMVQEGEVLLELLRTRPVDLLVVDSLLRGRNVFEVLAALPQLRLPHRPYVLVTACVANASVQKKLKLLGADFVLLKPYTLEGLWQAAELLLLDDQAYRMRCAQAQWQRLLDRLEPMLPGQDLHYLSEVAWRYTFDRRPDRSVGRLYREVAEELGLQPSAVESGIRRIVARAGAANTPEGQALYRLLALPPQKKLTAGVLVKRMALALWRELE